MTARVSQTVEIRETEEINVAFRRRGSVISATIRSRDARTIPASDAVLPLLIRVAGVVTQRQENAAVTYLLLIRAAGVGMGPHATAATASPKAGRRLNAGCAAVHRRGHADIPRAHHHPHRVITPQLSLATVIL